MAQSQETEQDEPGDDSDASSDDAEVSDADIEEIIVTGLRLKRTPSQIGANFVALDEDALQATGEVSLDRALRALPQNQLGASSLASYARLGGQHFNGATNLSGATAINLRGLGNGATLVLVDGKRMGSSGLTGGVTDIWLTELQPDGSLAVKVRSLTGDLTGQESTMDNASLLPEQDRISAMLGFDHDFGATRLSAQAYYMDRTTTTDQGDARFAHFLGSRDTPTGDSPAMYWSVSGIERLSTATQEVFRVNFDLTGSVFGMEWAFGAGATNDRSDNHHTGSFYASYDPDIPPHLADQFQAYKLASVRPDYVEFIGIETFREFWGQELSSGWTNTTDWAEATLSGSRLSLPGGDARFVVGAAWRSTGLKTDNKRNSYGHNSNNGSYWTEEPGLGIRFGVWDKEFVDENVGLFAEFAAPVLESLDLSAAVRWDDYNNFDSDTTYSVGAVWRPIGSVRLHSNLSTSYIIPTARDKVEDPNNFFIGQDWRCSRNADWAELGGREDCPGVPLRLQNPDGSLATTPGESFIYFSNLVRGGNPDILPEQGESISVGVELTPQAIPGLSRQTIAGTFLTMLAWTRPMFMPLSFPIPVAVTHTTRITEMLTPPPGPTKGWTLKLDTIGQRIWVAGALTL